MLTSLQFALSPLLLIAASGLMALVAYQATQSFNAAAHVVGDHTKGLGYLGPLVDIGVMPQSRQQYPGLLLGLGLAVAAPLLVVGATAFVDSAAVIQHTWQRVRALGRGAVFVFPFAVAVLAALNAARVYFGGPFNEPFQMGPAFVVALGLAVGFVGYARASTVARRR